MCFRFSSAAQRLGFDFPPRDSTSPSPFLYIICPSPSRASLYARLYSVRARSLSVFIIPSALRKWASERVSEREREREREVQWRITCWLCTRRSLARRFINIVGQRNEFSPLASRSLSLALFSYYGNRSARVMLRNPVCLSILNICMYVIIGSNRNAIF